MKDKYENSVELGDTVRVLEIPHCVLDTLNDEERPHIAGMLNREFEIDDFPEAEKVSVSIWWQFADGSDGFGGLYMRAEEFELVKKRKSA